MGQSSAQHKIFDTPERGYPIRAVLRLVFLLELPDQIKCVCWILFDRSQFDRPLGRRLVNPEVLY